MDNGEYLAVRMPLTLTEFEFKAEKLKECKVLKTTAWHLKSLPRGSDVKEQRQRICGVNDKSRLDMVYIYAFIPYALHPRVVPINSTLLFIQSSGLIIVVL